MFIAYGSVRGECGHRHRSPEGAEQCAIDDDRACRVSGGYSDRLVYDEASVERNALGYIYRVGESVSPILAMENIHAPSI